jgi:hypothetical protein
MFMKRSLGSRAKRRLRATILAVGAGISIPSSAAFA